MIALLTYDAPHRKTQDLLSQLLMCGFPELTIVATPWVAGRRFIPMYQHRPSGAVQVSLTQLCDNLGLRLVRLQASELNDFLSAEAFRHILIAGAGLLPPEVARNHKVINAHPGYLPLSKGLDSFKWAIYRGHALGVTTHYISEATDEGALIDRREVPVYAEDSYHSAAYRVYETEIRMLRESIALLEGGQAPLTSLADDRYPATRRMPNRLEPEMLARFEALRAKASSMLAI